MSQVPKRKPRSEYQGVYKDLQEQIDELRRKIEEIQEKDRRFVTIFQPDVSCDHRWFDPANGVRTCARCGETQ